MFVGEAPGAEEDRQGLPFVGRAGALLTELLEGIGMSREQVWITNVLRCRPPGNRDPQPIEIESCQPYTHRQVELIEPRVIATLGNFATKLLTGSRVGISRVRGTPQVREIAGRDGLPDAALPSGGGAADALARRHAARGLRQAARAPRAARSRGRGLDRRPRSSPEAPRLAPTSSTCSVDDTSSAPAPRRRRRSGRGWPPAFGPGDLVLVSGELGAGKTTLIRGACRELGVTEQVTSPTFTIGRRYRGRVPVSHLDLYRLDSLAGEDPGLLDDYLTPDAVAFVEWPAAAEPLLGERRIALAGRAAPRRRRSARGDPSRRGLGRPSA